MCCFQVLAVGCWVNSPCPCQFHSYDPVTMPFVRLVHSYRISRCDFNDNSTTLLLQLVDVRIVDIWFWFWFSTVITTIIRNDAANYNIYNHLLLYILPKSNPKINKNNVKKAKICRVMKKKREKMRKITENPPGGGQYSFISEQDLFLNGLIDSENHHHSKVLNIRK
jgi:hypothetical protein